MIGDVTVKMSRPTAERIDDLVGALDRFTAAFAKSAAAAQYQAAAADRLAAAIEASNALADCQLNGPNG